MVTNGISPKVAWPAIVLTVVGVVLVVVGIITDDKVVTDLGIGVLGAAGIGTPIGYAALPGNVVTPTETTASDSLLSNEARAKIEQQPKEPA